MEATYRAFKDRVNFIWVYGKEAHPGEECWDHPVTPTVSMPERAQRGRWMKYDPDPDLEIPMMIDYIAHETQRDEAIRASYGGGRPNTGYIIDCDGSVLEAHQWAWSLDGTAPGRRNGELLDFEDLADSLEAYLADPSACYQNEKPYVPPPTASVPELTPTPAPSLPPLPTSRPVEPTPTAASPAEIPETWALHLPLLFSE